MVYRQDEDHEPAPFSLDGLLVNLRAVEIIKSAPALDGRMEIRYTDSHVLIILSNGEGCLSIGEQEYRMRQDVVYACHPGDTFGAHAGPGEELDMYLLVFDLVDIVGDGRECQRCDKPAEIFRGKREIALRTAVQPALLCESIYHCWNSGNGLERFHGQILFQELLYSLLKYGSAIAEDSHAALERTKAYMESHFKQNLSIEQLARLADISPKYFVELFKKRYGISAIDYLSELRIGKARQLLAMGKFRLRDIAQEVGFSDEFYFSRKFKQETGISPTAYSASRRRKIAAYGLGAMGQLLPLNMLPYAAPMHPKWAGYYYRTYRADVPVHLSAYRRNLHWESNIEKLLSARPDAVISMDTVSSEEKERLNRVAPVLYLPWETKKWREHLRLTADFLGVPHEAEKWLEAYDRKVKTARERLKRQVGEETFLIISKYKDRCCLYANRSMLDVFYGDLGLAAAHAGELGTMEEPIEEAVSIERLALYDADHILVNVCQEPETLAHWEKLQGSSQWQELKAVRGNHVYVISSDPWREYSASAHVRQIDETLRLLTGNHPK